MKRMLDFLPLKLIFLAMIISFFTTPFLREMVADSGLEENLKVFFLNSGITYYYEMINQYLDVKFGTLFYIINFIFTCYSLLFFYVFWYSRNENEMIKSGSNQAALYKIIGYLQVVSLILVVMFVLHHKMLFEFDTFYELTNKFVYNNWDLLIPILGISFVAIIILWIGFFPLVFLIFKMYNYKINLHNPIDTLPEILLVISESITPVFMISLIIFLFNKFLNFDKNDKDQKYINDIKMYIWIVFLYGFLNSMIIGFKIPLNHDMFLLLPIFTILPLMLIIGHGNKLKEKYIEYKYYKNEEVKLNKIHLIKYKRKRLLFMNLFLGIPLFVLLVIALFFTNSYADSTVVLICFSLLFIITSINVFMFSTFYSLKGVKND